jgi:TPR repeat protein
MEMALEQMSQPNPEAQQQAQMAQQMQMEQVQAQTASLQAKAQRDQAEAQKAMVEAQLAPEESKAKIISSLTTNLDESNESKDFENRVKLAELMLKEKEIDQNLKVVELQTAAKQKKDMADTTFKQQFTGNQ